MANASIEEKAKAVKKARDADPQAKKNEGHFPSLFTQFFAIVPRVLGATFLQEDQAKHSSESHWNVCILCEYTHIIIHNHT